MVTPLLRGLTMTLMGMDSPTALKGAQMSTMMGSETFSTPTTITIP